jgi:general secretion pathway protein D
MQSEQSCIEDQVMKISGKMLLIVMAWLLCTPQLYAETVTLNLKDADISALISTVSEVADKNFIVDPRVKGKVTVVSSRPMNSDEVYQVRWCHRAR